MELEMDSAHREREPDGSIIRVFQCYFIGSVSFTAARTP